MDIFRVLVVAWLIVAACYTSAQEDSDAEQIQKNQKHDEEGLEDIDNEQEQEQEEDIEVEQRELRAIIINRDEISQDKGQDFPVGI